MTHIFISYSHKDSDYAHRLARALEKRSLSVWIDDRIDYGMQWPHVIEQYLDSCNALIVIMTPRSKQSEWVQNELNRAKRKGKPIFPLLLEGDEPWLSVEATQYVDVTDGNLPPDRFYSRLQAVLAPSDTSTSLGVNALSGKPDDPRQVEIARVVNEVVETSKAWTVFAFEEGTDMNSLSFIDAAHVQINLSMSLALGRATLKGVLSTRNLKIAKQTGFAAKLYERAWSIPLEAPDSYFVKYWGVQGDTEAIANDLLAMIDGLLPDAIVLANK
jgi:hypothetical protein